MKKFLIFVIIADVILVGLAVFRWTTATPYTPPLWSSFMQGDSSAQVETTPRQQRGSMEDSQGVSTLRRMTGQTDDVQGAMDSAAGDQFERAGQELDSREDRLDDARSRMRNLPGGGGNR